MYAKRASWSAIVTFLLLLVAMVFLLLFIGTRSYSYVLAHDTSAENSLTERFDAGDIEVEEYKTVPADLPHFAAKRSSSEVGDGLLFLTTNPSVEDGSLSYIMIVDNEGEPVFFQSLASGSVTGVAGFQKQGGEYLTYFERSGRMGAFKVLDNSYSIVAEYVAGNGYSTDGHDFKLFDNGHALMLGRDPRIVDMTQYDPAASTEAVVEGCIVQEVDQEGNVIFEWKSFDHFEITDTVIPLTENPLRYVHCNSIAPDSDGNLLLSSRHMNEITKIDRQTGAIIWRLGGKNSDFSFTNDAGFVFQHDAQRIANGNLTLYDNRTRVPPQYSRGIEYLLDETELTAERVGEYRTSSDTYGPRNGNMQTLPNENVLVGWGFSMDPMLTEFDRTGIELFALSTPDSVSTPRAFRFPWKGYPTWPAALVAAAQSDVVDLFFSWNGSTETVAYKVYAGQAKDQLTLIDEVAKDSFETTFQYQMKSDGFWYFQVIPIDSDGKEGVPSNMAIVLRGGHEVYLSTVVAGS